MEHLVSPGKKRLGIKGKLTLIILLLSSLPLTLLSIYMMVQQIGVQRENSINSMTSEIKSLKSRISLFLTRVESELTLVTKSTEMRKLFGLLENKKSIDQSLYDNTSREFQNILVDNDYYYKATILSPKGKEIISVIKDSINPRIEARESLSKMAKNYYSNVAHGLLPKEIFLSPSEIKVSGGNSFIPIIDFILPIFNKADSLHAIISVKIRAEKLFELLVSANTSHLRKIFIVNGEGYYIFHSEKKNNWNELFTKKSDENIFQDYSQDIAKKIFSGTKDSILLINDRILQFSPIFSGSKAKTERYFIIEDISEEEVLASLGSLKTILLTLVILQLIVTIFVGYKTAGSFLKPILQLIDGTRLIRTGNLDIVLKTSAKDEIKDLVDSFNELVQEWKYKQVLEKENRKLSQSVIQNPLAIIITNQNFVVEYVNPKVTEISGLTNELLKQTSVSVFNSQLLSVELKDSVLQSIQYGVPWMAEVKNLSKNGEDIWEQVTISAINDGEGKISNYLIIKKDISERKKMIDEIISMKERAEKLERLKSEFLNQMSHEIRTPINIINGAASILEDELIVEQNSELKKFFNSMKAGTERITRTIESILLTSELRSGTYETRIKETDIKEHIIPFVTQTGNRLSRQSEIGFVIEVPEGKLYAAFDEYSVQQIFSHLLDNAFKYTNKGSVSVSVSQSGEYIEMLVADTGIGMSEQYLENIFNPFTQEDQSLNRPYEGNGLGLTLIKEFCKLNNIDITCQSVKNRGTAFILRMKKAPTIR
ncbi:MAG: PAS domain S-box protein [Ignavibacteriales bacterium]|nr:PAS domain S-box protein [Ignavibacteriales bacterium]